MLDRVCTDALQLMDAKVLDVACLDLVQLQLFAFKIRQNLLHRHIPVGAVGRGFYRLFDSRQPQRNEVRKQHILPELVLASFGLGRHKGAAKLA